MAAGTDPAAINLLGNASPMATYIAEYEEKLRSVDNGATTVLQTFIDIFKSVDARLAGVEGTASSVAELQQTLVASGLALVAETVTPLRQQILAAADLGLVFTAPSVSPVAIGTGTKTFTVVEANRATVCARGHAGDRGERRTRQGSCGAGSCRGIARVASSWSTSSSRRGPERSLAGRSPPA